MPDTAPLISRQWLRRYKFVFFLIGLLLLCIQLLLAYLLPIVFDGSGDTHDTSSGSLYEHLLDERKVRQDKAIFNELLLGAERPSMDDEYISNSNSMYNHQQQHQQHHHNFKDPVVALSKTSSSTKDHSEGTNQKQKQSSIGGGGDGHLQLDDLNFKPICDIVSKEAISAIYRARTHQCKETIANISCAIQMGTFYPIRLPNNCPHDAYEANRALGCYQDDRKFRLLSGYYVNFKALNTPGRCIQMCLQSGFVYAGVQYSTECFCGNNIPDEAVKLSDPQCNHKCSGDSKQLCGGYFTISIFETGIEKFTPQVANLMANPSAPKARIAFLLTLNGRAVRQVYRLLKLIYSDQHYYYIHVDSRQDYMYRELLRLEEKTRNIRLARKRYSTIWGGASLLRMLLASMKDLLAKDDWHWDFVINLSESDFLVKNIDSLVEFLTANHNRNFVKSHGREVQRFIQKQGLDKTFVECDTHMWRVGDRTLPDGIQIDGGSDWIGLSRAFVEYVTVEDELIRGLLRVFHHTLLPAESFFHTALRNSEFCDTYVDNNLHVTNWKRRLGCKCQYKHVVDWCGCSPNDFKPDDWPRLMATDGKQLYFARKFEPIVNQAIIRQLEEWIVGPYPVDYPNLHSYWQSVYNPKDKSPSVDEAVVAVASSLACRRVPVNYSMKSIVEVTTYMDHDRYKGFLVHHEITRIVDENTEIVQLELWARPQQFGQVSRASPFGKRIKNIEVSTEYDQKEQLARNYAKIMGPMAEPTFILHLAAITATTKFGPMASTYNLTVLWLNPAGHLNDISDLYVDASTQSAAISFAKSTMKMPLLPGIWTAKLVTKQTLIAQCNFVIFPKLSSNNYTADSWTDLARAKKIDSQWEQYLPDETNQQLMEEQTIENAKLIDDEQIAWINKLTNQFFAIKDVCVVGDATRQLEQMARCRDTSWSSFAPDPKSEMFVS